MIFKRIFLIILMVVWMFTIFMFSDQDSEKSSNTSKKTIEYVIDKLPSTKDLPKKEKEKKIEKLQIPVRKIAHFSIYTVGGIISFMLMNEFKLTKKKRVLFSIMLCALYAFTDEFHQSFISGRSCEIRDVLIDSSGALLGIIITYFIYCALLKRKLRKNIT